MAQVQALGFRVARPYSDRVSYLEGFRATRGRMASIVNYLRLLVKTDDWQRVREVYPAWGKGLLGKPAKGRRFEKGRDVKDFGSGWRLPAEALQSVEGGDPFAPGVGLLVTPSDFEDGRGKRLLVVPDEFREERGVTVIPESILVVPNLAASGVEGKVDEKIGLAVEGSASAWADKAWNSYPNSELLRPGVRGYYVLYYYVRRDGGFDVLPSARFGVLEALDLPK